MGKKGNRIVRIHTVLEGYQRSGTHKVKGNKGIETGMDTSIRELSCIKLENINMIEGRS